MWVQNEASDTATLFATAKAATGLENRPEALPVWSGAREADVTSGATPKQKAALTLNLLDAFAGQKLTLFIEANASYDYTADYQESANLILAEVNFTEKTKQRMMLQHRYSQQSLFQ